MAEIKNEIITNVIARCENADEVVVAIGALVTAGVVSMNDVIKTMYNQYVEVRSSYDKATSSYEDEMSYYDDEIAALNEDNDELAAKIVELENELEGIWKVTSAFHYLEEMIDCIIVSEDFKNEMPE